MHRDETNSVIVVGGGLAGSEAAYFLAEKGVPVTLFEMRPTHPTPAHKTDQLAELVCSNSLKSKDPLSAPGLLKQEMRQFPSLVLEVAAEVELPGGQALVVDRALFSKRITEKISQHPHIRLERKEFTGPNLEAWIKKESEPSRFCLLASGPLTSESLTKWLQEKTSTQDLYFYDAISPIVEASSLDENRGFFANRYDKGEEVAYWNFPLSEEEYTRFIEAMRTGETIEPQAPFEKPIYFQACQPIENWVSSGKDSLRFGPMKPVGLTDPRTGARPYAVLQLRPENQSRTAYHLVGFQTKLTYLEQKRIFSLLPGFEKAQFLRYGSIHRNTYVNSPKVLQPNLSLKKAPSVFLAGQLTGVEGYLESAACGLLAAFFLWQNRRGDHFSPPPLCSALGALWRHITHLSGKAYVPSHIHFGLLYDSLEAPGISLPSLQARGLRKIPTPVLREEICKQSPGLFQDWRDQW